MKLSDVTNKSNYILKETPNVSIPTTIRQMANGYMFIAGNDVFRFTVGQGGVSTMREAQRMATELKDDWRLRGQRPSLRTQFADNKVNPRMLPGNTKQRVRQIGAINRASFPKTTALMNSGFGRVFMRLVRAFLVEEQIRNSILITMANIEGEFAAGEITEAEYVDKIQVAWGMYAVQLTAIMLATLRAGKSGAAIIRGIRTVVRGGQLAAGATGIGTVPAILSAIATEAGFQLAIYLITQPAVQKALVDWIVAWGQESLFGAMIQGGVESAGNLLNGAASVLNNITGGLVGSEDFFAASGAAEASGFTDPGARDIPGINGQAYATSQWARLVFQDMIFPPGSSLESKRVPYYNRRQREMMMAEDFGSLTTAPVAGGRGDGNAEVERRRQDGNQAPPAPITTSEPGMPVNPDATPGPQ